MEAKKLEYKLDESVVNMLLKVLDKTQVSGIQSAKGLLTIVEILKNPLNAEALEKESLAELKAKYEEKVDKKK